MKKHLILTVFFCIITLFLSTAVSAKGNGFTEVISTDNDYYPTFATYNPRVVEIDGTYFVAFQYKRDLSTTSAQFRIMKSTDKGRTWTYLYDGDNLCVQAPCLAADNNKNLLVYYMVYENGALAGIEHYMRFNSSLQLVVDKDMATDRDMVQCKYGFAYDSVHHLFYTSGRLDNGDMFVREYDIDGTFKNEYILNEHYGNDYWTKPFVWGDEYVSSPYQSITVDSSGRLHIVYSQGYRAGYPVHTSVWTKTCYMYSDWDESSSSRSIWKKADGTTVSIPHKANDFVNGGTVISVEPEQPLINNILVVDNSVHILYVSYSGSGNREAARYVRINRSTGNIEKRLILKGMNASSTLVEGDTEGTLYIFGSSGTKPSLFGTTDNGNTWGLISQIDRESRYGSYMHSCALQKVDSYGKIVGIMTDWGAPQGYSSKMYSDVVFASFNTSEDVNYYRLEKTASETTPTNGSSLRLDGMYNVKNEKGTPHGNPISSDGINFGTYQTSVGSASPVAHTEIKGVSSNSLFGKLSYSNRERVVLGDLDVGDGLTLEGWFYPTGDENNAQYQARLFTKRNQSSWRAGDYYAFIRNDKRVQFGVLDSDGASHYWLSASTNTVTWNAWNYICVTWEKGSDEVTFHIKAGNGPIRTDNITASGGDFTFPDNDSDVVIGYATTAYGYDGYFDEVRITNHSRGRDTLLLDTNTTDTSYYRLENTAAGNTPDDDESLSKDGPSGIKDENNSVNAIPISSHTTTTYGTYQSVDGDVYPVSASEIKGVSTNARFGKLSYDNIERVDLGLHSVNTGLTFEGWFYLTGNRSDAAVNCALFGKSYYYYCRPTTEGSLKFNIWDNEAIYEWRTEPGVVEWNKWFYMAVTWEKDSKVVDFYIKPQGSDMKHMTVVNNSVRTGFYTENSNAHTFLGFMGEYHIGFDGYFDECRISGFKRESDELLADATSVTDTSYYRMEATVSDNTAVTNGASLRLDGTYQIRDDKGEINGNPVSSDGINFGTYQTSVGSASPVAHTEIKGVSSNSLFGKLSYSNRERVVLGDLDVGDGLTLEGWFYPTGDENNAQYQARLFTKRNQSSWRAGDYYAFIRNDRRVQFGVLDSNNTEHYWQSAPTNTVTWNAWNYICITWEKGSDEVAFHMKPGGGPIRTDNITASGGDFTFPDNDSDVVIGYATTAYGYDGYFDEVRISDFVRTVPDLLIAKSHYYRFEETAAGTTQVSDGASLRLDGTSQIKDDIQTMHGNPNSEDGTNFGTYNNNVSGVIPVPYTNIKGADSNNYYASVTETNKESIDLGDIDAGSGLTLEGWFCPTGNYSSAADNGLLITKQDSTKAGNYSLRLNADRGVTFEIRDSGGLRKWETSDNIVEWGQWNYIAVVWAKNSQNATFYVKPMGEWTIAEKKSATSTVLPDFPNTDCSVRIGYCANAAGGFRGYLDEIRISDYCRRRSELLLADQWYYRLEKTASGTVPTDGASLMLDGASQVKDILNADHGNPISSNGIDFGTYESIDGSINPVPYTEIKNASDNSFFGKLSSANDEGISLGDIDVGRGLTIEGWFCPTGNQGNAYNNARLVTKCTTWRSGNYWLYMNATGGLTFGIKDSSGDFHLWQSDNNMISWNNWNYVAVTWRKNYKDVEFYVKQPGGALKYNQKTNTDTFGSFANTDDEVTIGYNPGLDLGFEGYFDEVRITDRRLNMQELLLNTQ